MPKTIWLWHMMLVLLDPMLILGIVCTSVNKSLTTQWVYPSHMQLIQPLSIKIIIQPRFGYHSSNPSTCNLRYFPNHVMQMGDIILRGKTYTSFCNRYVAIFFVNTHVDPWLTISSFATMKSIDTITTRCSCQIKKR